MHQKKSEAQIGEDSIVVSADFNPFLHLRQLPPRPHDHSPVGNSSSAADHGGNFLQIQVQSSNSERGDPDSLRQHHQKLISTPHKRPLMNSSLSHSQTFQSLESLSADPRTSTPARFPAAGRHRRYRHLRLLLYAIASTTKSTLRHLLRRLRLRLLLLSFPCLFLVLGGGKSTGDRSLLLGFLSAISFSSAIILLLIISFNLFPFPSLRLLLSRSSSYLLPRYHPRYHRGQSPPPVLWSIGSDPTTKTENLHSSGSWVQIYSNGDVYEGEFHHGKCSGSGVYYYYMSGRYEGDWIDDKYDGYGVETWAKGSRYRGQYRQGLRHGFGIYRFYTGDLYAGEWSSGQSHGCGVHTCEDGSRYVGEFKWGVKHGLGHYHFRNGDTYSGEYFADKMHGFGVYRYANGHRYEGAWHEGRRQGLGMYTFRNGETQSGYWEIGVLATTSTHNNLSSLPVAVNHSKVLNVVQEARCASEKAFNVPRVDERVNKAVAAANKAANAARVAAVKAVQKQMPGRSSNVSMP